MSSSAIATPTFQAKIGSIQNQADTSSVYSAGVWSFKNSTAVTSVTITDSGNVGIGTTSPNCVLDIRKGVGVDAAIRVSAGGRTPGVTNFELSQASDGSCYVYNRENNLIAFGTNNTERMRIDASGRLILTAATGNAGIGKLRLGSLTTPPDTVNGYVQIVCSANDPYGIAIQGQSISQGYIGFYTSTGALQGSISKSNELTTAFNTGASDYRLKESVQDLSRGLEKVKALRPVSFVWKNSGQADIGFIAHEIQSVVPECVTGEKDAVDSEGNPIYQSIFPAPAQMIASLVAAIQELSAKVDAQAAEIEALKAK